MQFSLPVVEGEGDDPARPALLQLILEVPSKSCPEQGGQSYQRWSRREGVPVDLTDDLIIQRHDITQFGLQQTLPEKFEDISWIFLQLSVDFVSCSDLMADEL